MKLMKREVPPDRVLLSDYLPVVGDNHPLRRRYLKVVVIGSIIAGVLHLAAGGGWYIARTMKREVERPRDVRVVKIADLGVPPSLMQRDASAAAVVAANVAPPSIGVPDPVPDFQAPNLSIATQDEMAISLTPTDLNDFGGSDSLVVDLSGERDRSPSPDDFVAYEDPPVLISISPPVYPEMARAAQAEGVVFVRVLVGKDGKVKDAFVRQGITMLNEAAIDAAKRAVFKPALSQHHPVEVWVEIPLRFSLN